jgi:hypothetical protein
MKPYPTMSRNGSALQSLNLLEIPVDMAEIKDGLLFILQDRRLRVIILPSLEEMNLLTDSERGKRLRLGLYPRPLACNHLTNT